MAVDRRQGTKVPNWAKQENTPGARIDPGPYVGIVKNNIDPARLGRLQVWIPDLGGDPNYPESWRTVAYASPFMGQTFYDPSPESSAENDFNSVPHSYGFWMVPPDINCQVLVTFVSGDPFRGYWFACLPPEYSHHMVPGIAASRNIQFDTEITNTQGGRDRVPLGNVDNEIKMSVTDPPPEGNGYPIAEFNLISQDNIDTVADLYGIKKPIHTEQFKVLREQGLIKDSSRGVHTSSSQRESPSQVFGISTPGVPLESVSIAGSGSEVDPVKYGVTSRRGGHVFVMDDGEPGTPGKNQLVKIRTANGHMLLFNDSDDLIYMINSKGNTWFELTGDGQINMYSDSGFNFRTQGTINLHADLDININANRKLNIRAGNDSQLDASNIYFKTNGKFLVGAQKIGIKSETALNLTAGTIGSFGAGGQLIFSGSCIGLNSASAPVAESPRPLALNTLDQTKVDSTTQLWVKDPGTLTSIVTIAPTHEPFDRKSGRTTNVDYTTGRYPKPGNDTDPLPPPAGGGDLFDIIVEFLKKEEGWPRGGNAYPDPPGQTNTYSIGYGHQITAQERSSGQIDTGAAGDQRYVSVKTPITDTQMNRTQGEALLKKDLQERYVPTTQRNIGSGWTELNNYQKAALVSYTYNTGSCMSLVRAGIVDLLNKDQKAAAGELITTKGIKTAGGVFFPPLDRRRRAETTLWNTTV